MAECLEAFDAYRTAHGSSPSSEFLHRVLDPEWRLSDGGSEQEDRLEELRRGRYNASYVERQDIRRDMWRGGLRLAAAMLIEAKLQRHQAENDIDEGLLRFRRSREKPVLMDHEAPTLAASTARALQIAKALQAEGKHVPTETRQQSAEISHVRAPIDPFKPPSYAGLRCANLPEEVKAEFRVNHALELVERLNELWAVVGRHPLPQGSFPSSPKTLAFVVKELRLALPSREE